MSISEFFTRVLGAELRNPRWSWGAENPVTNQLFLRVWDHDFRPSGTEEQILILHARGGIRSKGHPERKRHVDMLRRGARGYGVLCRQAPGRHGKGVVIRDFDEEELLEFGKIITEGEKVFAIVEGRVSAESVTARPDAQTTLLADLRAIRNRKLDATQKEVLSQARVGQGQFRQSVLKAWQHRCCVTEVRTLQAIRASHIKPWRSSSDEERLDPANGLPLVATLDSLFDAGLISFGSDGRLMVSDDLPESDRATLGLEGANLAHPPDDRLDKFLRYHRGQVFRA